MLNIPLSLPMYSYLSQFGDPSVYSPGREWMTNFHAKSREIVGDMGRQNESEMCVMKFGRGAYTPFFPLILSRAPKDI